MAIEFEYDPFKSFTNARKHGINFDEAQALWDDDRLLEVPANTVDEARYIVIGMIGRKHWAAICTLRGSRVRIISVRRAREQEVTRYESD